LRAGEFPRLIVFRDLRTLGDSWHNVNSGLMPPAEIILFYYSNLDLAAQPYRYRSFLDQIGASGFVRSRFYRTEQLARAHQEFILKGLSVPSYELSAMTLRNVIRFWLRYPRPMYRILRGNMQQMFIEPIERRLESRKCLIRTGLALERIELDGRRVARLHFREAAGNASAEDVERVVIAIPHDRMAQLIDDSLYAAAPGLASIEYLRSRPMAAFDVYFN
jgi:protoporphyrinogen oxidase